MYSVGDIVLSTRGQRTNFFEINKVEDNKIWITNGHIQITRKSDEIELICKADDRYDAKIPFVPWYP